MTLISEFPISICRFVDCAAKTEVYHHNEHNCNYLESIYSMQEVLLMTCAGNFYFLILLPEREIYFPGLDVFIMI